MLLSHKGKIHLQDSGLKVSIKNVIKGGKGIKVSHHVLITIHIQCCSYHFLKKIMEERMKERKRRLLEGLLKFGGISQK